MNTTPLLAQPRPKGWSRQLTALSTCSLVCLSVVSVLFLLVGVALPVYITAQVHNGLIDTVVVGSPKADGFEQFRNKSSDGDNLLLFHFFNVTNPHAVLQGDKPNVEELGPFVYQMNQIRKDFHWDHAHDLVTFREHSYYSFDRVATHKATGGRFSTDDIKITTVNMLFLGMKAKLGVHLWELVCDTLLWRDDFDRLFTRNTVADLIQGYSVSVAGFPIRFPGLFPNTTENEDPNFVKPITMKVGAKNHRNAYQMVKWQNSSHVSVICPWDGAFYTGGCPTGAPCCGNKRVPVWGTERVPDVYDSDANLVHGTNGEQFWPNVKKSDKLIIFNDIIQRALQFHSVDPTETYRGIKLIPFEPTHDLFENYVERPANARYYNFGHQGIVNLTMVEQGCDLYFSLPHFLSASNAIQSAVTGLAPNPGKHKMKILVEPHLGQTMVEHVRAQVNARLPTNVRPPLGKTWFPKVRDDTFVPVGWFEEYSAISEQGAKKFKVVYTMEMVVVVMRVVGVLVGVLSGAVMGYSLFLKRKGEEDWGTSFENEQQQDDVTRQDGVSQQQQQDDASQIP